MATDTDGHPGFLFFYLHLVELQKGKKPILTIIDTM